MALFSLNPYSNYQAANLKECISLDKGTKQDFHPETHFDLIPGKSDAFSEKIERYSKKFGYGSLLNAPTNQNVDTSDANKITYSSHVNIINTWNKISDDLIARNSNEVWGTHDWMISCAKQIEEMTIECGEVAASALTKVGKKKFMECWKSTILSHQVMALLTPEAQASIEIHKDAYQWMDPQTDETVEDGHSLLNKVLKLMCPDVQANVYMELAKIKSIKSAAYAFNMIKWPAIESKCISIEQKLPGSYHELQLIMDYLDVSLTVELKSFKSKISIIRNKYLRDNPDKWTASYISGEIIKTCNNMSEDGTWQREIGEKDQIIALTTKVAKLQTKLEKQVVAFDIQAKSVINPSSEINANGGKRCGKRMGCSLSQNGA
jgi:hypothetical protein